MGLGESCQAVSCQPRRLIQERQVGPDSGVSRNSSHPLLAGTRLSLPCYAASDATARVTAPSLPLPCLAMLLRMQQRGIQVFGRPLGPLLPPPWPTPGLVKGPVALLQLASPLPCYAASGATARNPGLWTSPWTLPLPCLAMLFRMQRRGIQVVGRPLGSLLPPP